MRSPPDVLASPREPKTKKPLREDNMGAYQGLGRLAAVVVGSLVLIGDVIFLIGMSKDVFG